MCVAGFKAQVFVCRYDIVQISVGGWPTTASEKLFLSLTLALPHTHPLLFSLTVTLSHTHTQAHSHPLSVSLILALTRTLSVTQKSSLLHFFSNYFVYLVQNHDQH